MKLIIDTALIVITISILIAFIWKISRNYTTNKEWDEIIKKNSENTNS